MNGRSNSCLGLMSDQITYLDEYYLTNYEIELLKRSSAELASKIPAGSMVIELGSGFVLYFNPACVAASPCRRPFAVREEG